MSEQRIADPGDVKQGEADDKTQSVRFTQTQEEAQAAIDAAAVTATAASFGVDEASFDKFYKDGNFDWVSYGKEQEFKAKQAAPKEGIEPVTEPNADDAAAKEAEAAKAADAQSVAEQAGVDWDAAAQQIAETGELTAEDKAKMLAIGVPEVVIDDYVRIVTKEIGDHVDNVQNAFGGEEQFTAVFNAVQENATDAQKDQIDSLLRDPATFTLGVQMAHQMAKMEPAPGVRPPMQGDPAMGGVNQAQGGAAVKGFENFDAQVAAQSDPKYKTDPEYRAQVMQRIAASNFDMNVRTHTSGL